MIIVLRIMKLTMIIKRAVTTAIMMILIKLLILITMLMIVALMIINSYEAMIS